MVAQSPGLSTLLGMGAIVAAVLAVGLALGLILDSVAGTAPVFLFVGLAVGIVGAVGYTITKFREFLKT